MGAMTFQLPGLLGALACIPALVIAYFTIAPLVALIICYVEEILS